MHEQWRGVGAGRREDRCRSLPTTVVSDLKSVHSSSVARSRDHRPHVLSQSSARRDTTGSSARHAIVNLSHKPIQYNTKFVKRHVAVALEALANRTVKKHGRKRTDVL